MDRPGPDPKVFGSPGGFGDAFRGFSFQDALAEVGAPGQATGVTPPPGGDPVRPWSRQEALDAGVPYRRVAIYPPFANVAADPDILYMVRWRPVFFGGTGSAAGALQPQPLQFSQPTIIYARNAGAMIQTLAGLPVGMRNLDTFASFTQRNNGDALDGGTNPVLGSALYGSGENPGLYAANGIFFNNGSTMQVNCTLMVADALVHLVFATLEEYGNPRSRK